ncbi:hypothetical protein MMC07_009641 [Pseudocyphellaria aurata]|nr:hypothetical protein [Pseudocyphellaria aurata]
MAFDEYGLAHHRSTSAGSRASVSSPGRALGDHPNATRSTVSSPNGPVSTVTPSLRNAAACRVAPPGPLQCHSAAGPVLGAVMDEDHQPGRYDAFGVDHALPWNIAVMKEVVSIGREGRKMLEAGSNLSKMRSVTLAWLLNRKPMLTEPFVLERTKSVSMTQQ